MLQNDIIAPPPQEGQPYDVIIIGSGPAGLTAGIYTTRGALSTLIVGGTKWGGQLMLTTEVENYPGFPEGILGPELMEKMRKQTERFGGVFLQQDVTAVDFSHSTGSGQAKQPFEVSVGEKKYAGKSVIIATGADTIWLGLKSEQRLIGRGVSSCAPCDAPFFREKDVIVIGGGDSAMEEALVLTKYAKSVTIVHRRDAFRASEIMQKRVLSNPKIKVLWNSEAVEILGDQKVTGVKLKNTKTEELKEIPIDGIFVAIGHSPMTKIFGSQIELDAKGYVKQMLNDKQSLLLRSKWPQRSQAPLMINTLTSVEGVFVAGDVHDHHYRQAVTAAGFGCMAAMDAEKWLDST